MAAPVILAVDDDRDICNMLGDGLALYGYRAECAITAEAALELTRSHAFDLAVVDLRLRGSMCDDALALALTKLRIPVIMVSGIIDAEERLSRLPYPYLLKPYHWDALMAMIAKTLRRAALHAE